MYEKNTLILNVWRSQCGNKSLYIYLRFMYSIYVMEVKSNISCFESVRHGTYNVGLHNWEYELERQRKTVLRISINNSVQLSIEYRHVGNVDVSINCILRHSVTVNRSNPNPGFVWGKENTILPWPASASDRRGWLRHRPALDCARSPFAVPKASPEATVPSRHTRNT